MNADAVDLDAIEAAARRGISYSPDHDPYYVSGGLSAGDALDLVAELREARAAIAHVEALRTQGRVVNADAVQAAVDALIAGEHRVVELCDCNQCRGAVAVAVAAAEPVIRAQIAAEREAEAAAVKHYRTGPARCACGYDAYKVGGFFPDYHAMFMNHLDNAARIARGES